MLARSISVGCFNIGLSHHFFIQSSNSIRSAFKSKKSEYKSKSIEPNFELMHLLRNKKYSDDIIFFNVSKVFF